MTRYYCDYCDMYLPHDSPMSRRQHNYGWKHRDNYRHFYEKFLPKTQGFMPPPGMMPPGLPPGLTPGMLPPGMPRGMPPPGMPPPFATMSNQPRGPPAAAGTTSQTPPGPPPGAPPM